MSITERTNSTFAVHSGRHVLKEVDYQDLIPILVQCFAIILLGYVTGRCRLINSQGAAAINTFVTFFSLPSLIFSSIVNIDFTIVQWQFLASVFIAKAVVFIGVATVTFILTKPSSSGKAGLYAIFSTQSNDYALGYPLVLSLYKNEHRKYAEYIYLLVPIQLVILNPVGFIMMEFQKQNSIKSNEPRGGKNSCFIPPVLKGIISNPVILLTFLGIIANFSFNHSLPQTPVKIMETLGAAFPALALFLLGHNMVGKMSCLKGYALVEPALLIVVKILVLPILIRELINQLPTGLSAQDRKDLGSFGFLYGTFPTAPPVFIFASQFGLDTRVVSSGMVACTVLSAPLMFISATMSTLPVSDFTQFRATLITTVFWVSIVSLVCCIWVLIVFCVGRKWKSFSHSITMNLIFAQILAALGGILWEEIDVESKTYFYSQYILSVIGVFATRTWTALLAVMLATMQWRSLCFVLTCKLPIIIGGHILSIVAAVALIVGLFIRPPLKYIPDPNFQFGRPEAYVAFGILAICLLITVICLIIQQKFRTNNFDYNLLLDCDTDSSSDSDSLQENLHPDINTPSTSAPLVVDIEDLTANMLNREAACSFLCPEQNSCSDRQRKRCSSEVRRYLKEGWQKEEFEHQHQLLHHVVFLILLCISMTVGLAVCLWKIIHEDETGIFIELELLDVVLNFGQGIFTFFVFGLDSNLIIAPLKRKYRQCRYGSEYFPLPAYDKLEEKSLQICGQFLKYHYASCVTELISDKNVGRRTLCSVFRGKELVSWLVAVGLAQDRKDGEGYGQHLLLGRIIQHVNQTEDFQDNCFVYRFLPRPAQNENSEEEFNSDGIQEDPEPADTRGSIQTCADVHFSSFTRGCCDSTNRKCI